jgi:3-hydroxyisobutyrate dehydrogenase-like beta-hydroxyacid dehydrogenase
METVGVIGVGKIGLPIAENLIKSGFRVIGYRRSSLAEFEKLGGIPAKSPADVGAQCDIVFSLVPTADAMDEVISGPNGLLQSARPGQIVAELGSHLVPDKEKHVAPFAKKGVAYVDGEVSGTPGMVTTRKAVIYLGGDADACRKLEPAVKGFADMCLYFGPFGAASKVKLVNNLLVAVHIAAAAEAMALGLKAGLDVDLMIKAIANGSGGSTQFGIRAPWMAHRKFLPVQGSISTLAHYFDLVEDWADRTGTATPMLDRAVEIYKRGIEMGLGDAKDIASTIEVIESMPRKKKA